MVRERGSFHKLELAWLSVDGMVITVMFPCWHSCRDLLIPLYLNMYCNIKSCLLLSFHIVLLEPAGCNEILKPDVTCCGICIMPLVKFEALNGCLQK